MRSHCRPNTSRIVPTTSRSESMGMWVSAGPNPATMTLRAPTAAATPHPADRQPRVTETARTIVSASTISTLHARNAARSNSRVMHSGSASAWSSVRPSTLAPGGPGPSGIDQGPNVSTSDRRSRRPIGGEVPFVRARGERSHAASSVGDVRSWFGCGAAGRIRSVPGRGGAGTGAVPAERRRDGALHRAPRSPTSTHDAAPARPVRRARRSTSPPGEGRVVDVRARRSIDETVTVKTGGDDDGRDLPVRDRPPVDGDGVRSAPVRVRRPARRPCTRPAAFRVNFAMGHQGARVVHRVHPRGGRREPPRVPARPALLALPRTRR